VSFVVQAFFLAHPRLSAVRQFPDSIPNPSTTKGTKYHEASISGVPWCGFMSFVVHALASSIAGVASAWENTYILFTGSLLIFSHQLAFELSLPHFYE
jgi:hypothetical protein